MIRKDTLVPAVLTAIVAIALSSAFGYSSLRSAPAAVSTPPSGIGLWHLGDSLPNATNQLSYSLVLVSEDDVPAAAALPGRSLVYRSGTDVPVEYSDGVPYSEALANGWLLENASGDLITNTDYGYYIGDVGSSGYQEAFITNALAYLSANPGLEGVFIDNVLRDIDFLAGEYPAKYPTQSAWEAAMLSFVEAVGPALRSHGYYVLLNADGYTGGDGDSNDGTLTISWWQQLGPSVDGLMNEHFQQISDGSNAVRASGTDSWTENWDGWQRLIGTAQAMDKDFVGLTYGDPGDTGTMTYGKASFLQEWNGGGSAFIFNPTDNSDPWDSSWTTDIGQPAAAKQEIGTGWMRRYTDGIALVNPSPTSSQTFELGDEYLTSTGAVVTSVTLEPTSGLILRSTTATTTTTTAATPTPTVAAFSPGVASVGASVTISGNGFTGATRVTFNGATASFIVTSDTEIRATVPTGSTTGPITVTTPGGSATSTDIFTVTVPDFSLAVSPASRTVSRGGSASYSVTVNRLDSFTGSLQLSVIGLPTGSSASFSTNPVPSSGTTATLTIKTGKKTSRGTHTPTIRGTSGGLVYTSQIVFKVQ